MNPKQYNSECPICFASVIDEDATDIEDAPPKQNDEALHPVVVPCCSREERKNIICSDCFDRLVNSTNTCPFCRGKLDATREQVAPPPLTENEIANLYRFPDYMSYLRHIQNNFNHVGDDNGLDEFPEHAYSDPVPLMRYGPGTYNRWIPHRPPFPVRAPRGGNPRPRRPRRDRGIPRGPRGPRNNQAIAVANVVRNAVVDIVRDARNPATNDAPLRRMAIVDIIDLTD